MNYFYWFTLLRIIPVRKIRIEKKECTQEKIASEFGVNKATVSRWMSKEQMASIKEAYENNTVGTRKRLRSSVYEDLEITIHEWFKQHRALNLPINGLIVLKKAEYFATFHGYKDFKPSKKKFFSKANRLSATSDKCNTFFIPLQVSLKWVLL